MVTIGPMAGFEPFTKADSGRWRGTADLAAAEDFIGGRGVLITVMRDGEVVHVAYTGRRRLRRTLARIWQAPPVSGGRRRGWTAQAGDLVAVARCHDRRSAKAIAERLRSSLSRKK